MRIKSRECGGAPQVDDEACNRCSALAKSDAVKKIVMG